MAYWPLVSTTCTMVRWCWVRDAGATWSKSAAGSPETGFGTYEPGFLSAARATVVLYTAPGLQHVAVKNVTCLPVMIGEPNHLARGSSAPFFFGTNTSVAPTENLLVFQLYSVKPQPATVSTNGDVIHTSMYGIRTFVLSGMSAALVAHRPSPALDPPLAFVQRSPPR